MFTALMVAALAGIILGLALTWAGCALGGLWLGWRIATQPLW